MNKWLEKEIHEMIGVTHRCEGIEDLTGLFELILTPRELNDMARRYMTLVMLNEGASYRDIRQKLGVSNSTISRISSGVGFGFRRNTSMVKKETGETKEKKKKGIKYKGSPPLIRLV